MMRERCTKVEARVLIRDQVKIALPVFLFLVGEAMEFLGQRTQRLGEQPQLGDFHRQLAGAGAEERAFGADDVAKVMALEGVERIGPGVVESDVELDAVRHVLDGAESSLAHDAFEHQTSGHRYLLRLRFQLLVGPAVEALLQIAREVTAIEVVGESDAALADCGELGATLFDDLVGVGLGRLRFSHGDQESCTTEGAEDTENGSRARAFEFQF